MFMFPFAHPFSVAQWGQFQPASGLFSSMNDPLPVIDDFIVVEDPRDF